ncbi:MAG TPA: glycosyltransferase [Casimicrobiaceae bacterium]|nr:glycosyltransferase [Casimicrobiaceae bacterium]
MSRKTIHLVNPFASAFGGSERRALDYHALLSTDADVILWAERNPDVALAGYPFRRLDPAGGTLPHGGTLVLLGTSAERSHWLARARPERLIIVYNTPELQRLRRLIEFASEAALPKPELVFPSVTHRASTQMAGFVDWGFYDFNLFRSAPRPQDSDAFVVGRLSRDTDYKHHPQDVRLYRQLVARGIHVRLMGATVLRERLGGSPAIELLPAGAVPAPSFLQSLDAFVYRTDPTWREASGRVVVEAMACALPVVAGRSGGYRELIVHGTNGFLFDTQTEAIGYIETLRSDRSLAQRVGHAARTTVVSQLGEAHIARVREYFLGATDGTAFSINSVSS